VPALKQLELRERIYQMRMEGRNEYEIAAAVGRSQGRVSQILNKEIAVRAERQAQTAEHFRAFELQRIDSLISRGDWFTKAAASPRIADTLLQWTQRIDRLRGLYSDHHVLSINGQANPAAPVYDYTKLTEEQLHALETLLCIMAGEEPPPPFLPLGGVPDIEHPAPTAQVLLEPARLTDQRIDESVVAVVEHESLAERIRRLHSGGLTDANQLCARAGCSIDELHQAINGTMQ
jgi:hypothetical protein